MNILGYSGLHNSIAFRREHFPDLTEQEYRMCQGLDSAACIFVNGKLIAAAEEERFNGDKYTCDFPINAINFCLEAAKLNIHDIIKKLKMLFLMMQHRNFCTRIF